jgi:sec-independent protein translocase protein TatB
MFEVGFTEIILILGLALLVLGPEKLPDLARKVGRWTGRARSMARQLRTQLEQEVSLDELAKSRAAETSTTAAAPAPDTHASSAPAATDSEPATPAYDHSTHNPDSPSETHSHDAIDAGAPAADSSEPPKNQL